MPGMVTMLVITMLVIITPVITHILMEQDPIRAQQYIAMPIMLQLTIVTSTLTLGMAIIIGQRDHIQLLTLDPQEFPIRQIHLGIVVIIITTLAIIHILQVRLPTPQPRLAQLHTLVLRTQLVTTLATTMWPQPRLPTPQARLAQPHILALRTQLGITLEHIRIQLPL